MEELKNDKTTEIIRYEKYYSEEKLQDKIAKFAKVAGGKVIYHVLVLFYLLQDKKLPLKTKLKIYGVLGYFILPTDLIPDLAVGFGYTDDMAALIWVLNTLADSITPEIEKKARDSVKSLGLSNE